MRKMRLGTKLLTGGLLMVVVPLIIVGIASVYKSTQSISTLAEESIGTMSGNLAATIDIGLREEFRIAENMAKSNSVIAAVEQVAMTGQKENLLEIAAVSRELTEIKKAAGDQYETVFLTGRDGVIFADGMGGSYHGINVSDREYIQKALKGTPNMGVMVRSKKTGNVLTMAAYPVRSSKDGDVIGVAALAISLKFLTDTVDAVKVGKTGYSVLVDKSGVLITHPNKKHILTLDISKLKGMEIIAEKVRNQQPYVGEYTFEGVKKVSSVAPVEITGWSVFTAIPIAELYAPAYFTRNLIIGIGFISLVCAAIFFYFFARSVSVPINRAVGALLESAEQIGSASSQVSSSSQQLAEGAGEQASSIEETSSSLEELASMTRQNADNAQQANSLVKEAGAIVDDVNNKLEQMTTAIQDIDKNSSETQKIIKTIDEIAFQTNLLALNAAVEAARAGEAGAGFAVVAEEVRNLAQRSAEAAKNTNDLIGNTVKSVKEGARLCGETNEAFQNNAGVSRKTSDLVSEIAAASQEQAQGIEQINRAVAEMDKVTQQNAANAEESAAASEEMNAQAEGLKAIVTDLSALVGRNNGNDTSSNSFKIGLRRKKQISGNTEVAIAPVSRMIRTMSTPGKVVKPEDIIPLEEGSFQDF